MANGDIALQGEMGSVAAVGGRLSQLDLLNAAMVQLNAGVTQVQSAGHAATLSSLMAACQPISSHAQNIASARTRAGSALVSYASEVQELQNEVRRLLVRKADAEARSRATAVAITDIDHDAPDARWQARRLDMEAADARAEVQHVEQALSDCDQARLNADQRCAAMIVAQTGALRSISSSLNSPGGSVSLATLVSVAVRSSQKSELDTAIAQLTAAGVSPEEAARRWKVLGLAADDVQQLPVEDLFKLANVDGLPAWARDIASQAALKYSIAHPQEAYELMGFAGSDLGREDFETQILALQAALRDAQKEGKSLNGSPVVQMLGFGNHDGALTTAISFGDLDRASNVAVNAPGIGSTVDGIGNALDGANALFRAADSENSAASYAVVTWYGYHTPGLPLGDWGVWNLDRANAGAPRLAGLIDGIYAARDGDIAQMTVLAHSYGSTMATQALKKISNQVDAYVTYGSAGIENGTKLSDLHVAHMYSTHAAGDQTAPLGYHRDKKLNPIDIQGVTEFSSEDGEYRVTAHSMFTEDHSGSLLNWGTETGYLSDGTSSLAFMAGVVAGNDGQDEYVVSSDSDGDAYRRMLGGRDGVFHGWGK